MAATLLGLLVLWGLRSIESAIPSVHNSRLVIALDAEAPTEHEIWERLQQNGFRSSPAKFVARVPDAAS